MSLSTSSAANNFRWRAFYRHAASSVLLALLSVAVLLPATPTFRDLFGGDTGVFLCIGDLILKGGIPYRDVWDHKAPLIYYINALGLLLGGGSIWGLWFVEVISLYCAARLGWRLLNQAFGPRPAMFGSVLWLASLALVLIGGNYTEEFALPFQFAALYLFWQSEQQGRYGWRGVAFGLTLACVVLLRPNLFGAHLAMVAVMCLRGIAARRWRDVWLNLGLIAGGTLAGLLPVAWYFAANGALADLVDQVFRYSAFYSSATMASRLQSLLIGIVALAASGISIIALFAWLVSAMQVRREIRRIRQANVLLLLALFNLPLEFVLSTLSGRVYGHYYVAWLPAFAVLAAWFAGFVIERIQPLVTSSRARLLLPALTIALCIGPALRIIGDITTPKDLDNSRYQSVSYILKSTREQDYVLVWGAETALHLVAGRGAPTRFVYQYPLYTRGYERPEMVREFYHDLVAKPPALIIDTTTTNSLVPPLDPAMRAKWAPSDATFRVPPEMGDVFRLIEGHYTLAGRVGREQWAIYRYTEAGSANAGCGACSLPPAADHAR